ncbi:putative 60S ribosomal protein L7 [Melia azedarach]|uniref:60S ribosomal protein L7 n=1 Tax=Melia azedarach TaxID=155640 RepID=A0ACC1WWZ5_MELAZ|nr:putative 60S ribosomal protein L7 [Melia azedarach]
MEEESKPLPYVAETVLKKRKSTEALALTRKAQLELGKYGQKNKKNKVEDIKRAEQFIKQFRDQELDLIRMKQRGKRSKSVIGKPKSKLLFIVRIQGATEGILEVLQKVEPYVTYGYPNLMNVKELIYKKGYANLKGQRIPLTDNNIIEQELGKYGIICVEDIVHEIANVGPQFKEVISFLGPFILNKPEGGLLGKKQPFRDGGEAGNREDQINELISKMN